MLEFVSPAVQVPRGPGRLLIICKYDLSILFFEVPIGVAYHLLSPVTQSSCSM